MEPGRRRRRHAAAAARGPRRPGVRGADGPDRDVAGLATGRIAAAPRRPARPGRARRVVLRLGAVRPRAGGEVLPAIGRAVAVDGRRSGWARASGGLAMLHAQRRHPDAFGGLFLQSGSFFMPRFDHMEKDFRRYGRIVRFVRGVLRERALRAPRPGDADLRPRRGQRPQQPARRGRAEAAGLPRQAARSPRRPRLGDVARTPRGAPRRPARGGGALMERRHIELWAPGHRRERRRARLRPLRPARARVPDRARPRVGVREQRDGRRVAGWSRPGRVKLYCVDSYDEASWSNAGVAARGARPSPRPLRGVDPRPGRAVDPRRLRRRAGDRHDRLHPAARRPCSTSRRAGSWVRCAGRCCSSPCSRPWRFIALVPLMQTPHRARHAADSNIVDVLRPLREPVARPTRLHTSR